MMNLQRKYNIYSGFLILMLLNIFDGIATYIGLKKGFYIEENVILDYIYQYSSVMFIMIKIVLPTIVLLILMTIVGKKVTNLIKGMLYFSNTIYLFLFIYHIALFNIAINLAKS